MTMIEPDCPDCGSGKVSLIDSKAEAKVWGCIDCSNQWT